ncbi:MAG: type 1 glutamine amidotransferase [Anaerolineales bacterium]|nr:type 1 glutamine amidotransferase [Anaerolineales bacterium]
MKLKRKRVAVLIEDGFEDLEFWVPVMRLREEGAQVTVVGSGRQATFRGKNGLDAQVDIDAAQAQARDFDAVVVPGGWAPDKLRRYPEITALVREADQQGKIIAAICHAGSVLISAGILKDRKATGTVAIKDDLVNAGAQWVDAPAFREGNLVWGRVVADIPDFCRELVAALAA